MDGDVAHFAAGSGERHEAGPAFPRSLPRWLHATEYLDTDRMRNLHYGNLVLRRSAHLYLGYGVLVAISFLAVVWFVVANLDVTVAGRRGGAAGAGSGSGGLGAVISMVQVSVEPASAAHGPQPLPEPARHEAFRKFSDVSRIRRSTSGQVVAATRLSSGFPSSPGAATAGASHSGGGSGSGTGPSGAGSGTGTGGSGSGSGFDGVGDDASIFGTCDQMPSFIEQCRPEYPEAARRERIEGRVVLKVLVGENGRALRAQVLHRYPSECLLFDAAALRAVLDSRYAPALSGGRAVRVWCLVPVNFRLDRRIR